MQYRMRMTKKQMLAGVGRTDIEDTRMLARNVLRYTLDNVIHVRYCETDIIKIDKATGNIRLNSGGYHVRTTKKHMNAFQILVYVFQEHSKWYVVLPNGREVEFFDGIGITPLGSVLPASFFPELL